jgi:hypothetical protein
LITQGIGVSSNAIKINVVSIVFEDRRLLKAQLFLVPHDRGSNPTSANIDFFEAEEINHVRNRCRSSAMLAAETESYHFCFQILRNQWRPAGVQSIWGGKLMKVFTNHDLGA